ncbi:hypothetical protein D3C81_2027250 [compost metagenome]
MQLHDFLAQCQAETGSAFLASDLHERLEDPPLLTVGNAFAVVLDTDDDPIAVAPGVQAYPSAGTGVTQGVVEQIIEYPLQLWLIGLQARQGPLHFHQQTDFLLFGRCGKA